jgi:hypothetical protein
VVAPSSSTNRTKRASSIPWLSIGAVGERTRSEMDELAGKATS